MRSSSICAGVSFTHGTPGSCWFKSAMPNSSATSSESFVSDSLVLISAGSTLASNTAPECAGGQRNMYSYETSDGSNFDIQCANSFTSTPLFTFESTSLQACIDSCAVYGPQCGYVQWVPTSSPPSCVLLSNDGGGSWSGGTEQGAQRDDGPFPLYSASMCSGTSSVTSSSSTTSSSSMFVSTTVS